VKNSYRLPYPAPQVFNASLEILRTVPKCRNLLVVPEILTVYVEFNKFLPALCYWICLNAAVEPVNESSCMIHLSSSLPWSFNNSYCSENIHAMTYFMHLLVNRLASTR